MKLSSIKNIDVKGKRVLVRVDFNVPIVNGKVSDDFRIKKTLPTIKFLKKKGAKIILLSHISFGRGTTLRPVAKYINKHFKVDFIPYLLGAKVEEKISKMKNGEVLLLENVHSDPGEKENNRKFAEQIAKMGDIFVNEAFSESHRKYASIVSVPKLLPSYTGLLFEEEINQLKGTFNPSHLFLLILGGIQFGTKLGVLKKFIKIADKIFIGGALANNFFVELGLSVEGSFVDETVDIKKYVNHSKVCLPIDVKKKDNMILDIGSNTIDILSDLIKKSKFILWNGPLGDFEKKGFEKGTFSVARLIAKSNAKSIVGGGDTVSAINELGLINKFSFVSTAGGAMLEFLSKGTLLGIEALRKSKVYKVRKVESS